MDFAETFWGHNEPLTVLQMACRGIAIFVIALLILRISGRRSFGVGTPLDNIVVILVGAILSRAITGASPFLPVVAAALVIAALHRLFSWFKVHSTGFAKFTEGKKILLYEKDHFIPTNMRRALADKEDIMQALREDGLPGDFSQIDKVYMERNGTISIIQKKQAATS